MNRGLGILVAVIVAASEAQARPLVDAGPPFGKLPLVDEIDCALAKPGHEFAEGPSGASRVETILGKRCRVLRKSTGEGAYFAFRIGGGKRLVPGAAYLLAVEYPEDAPRSVIVRNGGCETSLGFHTGNTFGDAFHPKYVNNNNESLKLPLSGRYETWMQFFHLHDRFPGLKFPRGKGPRPYLPPAGFSVVICQFSAENIPASRGAAVSRIRLFEVPDPSKFSARRPSLPEGLATRRLFWREEMADGVIAGDRQEERGLKDPLDWYRYKADLMDFLCINTFSKDLLEFGACQGWDSTAGGGNDWVYFNYAHKDLWRKIVALMGERGFDVLPYYEYSGSKGRHGLGNQRRAKPLTRDDAYTHIQWIETANADITDPDTYADFKKMLDLTIVRHRDKARFAGVWIRPRGQLPMSFGDGALARFSAEANGGAAVTRKMLIQDKTLLARYRDWWYRKRRQFLGAMRDHLKEAGVASDPVVLFTACLSEPGVSFPTWEKRFVTDDTAAWTELLKDPAISQKGKIHPLDLAEVIRKDLYLEALLAPPLDWGGWEVGHANPPADPARYRSTPGVLMTHAFNRLYTVASPRTFEVFRGPAGLAIVRHYTLNENMMFDARDQPRLGYFTADVELAGPFCMMAEAVAMARGDPTFIGYLVGLNFNRGFPRYVRGFNEAFLSLPALPSKILDGAASVPDVVVRAIETKKHGTYLAVVNTGWTAAENVTVRMPRAGKVTDAVTGRSLDLRSGAVTLSLYPCQLRALRVE